MNAIHEGDEADDPSSIVAFRDLLHECCMLPGEAEFWTRLRTGIDELERGLDRNGIARFEYAIDSILVRHGLPAWSMVKMQHREPPAAPQ